MQRKGKRSKGCVASVKSKGSVPLVSSPSGRGKSKGSVLLPLRCLLPLRLPFAFACLLPLRLRSQKQREAKSKGKSKAKGSHKQREALLPLRCLLPLRLPFAFASFAFWALCPV